MPGHVARSVAIAAERPGSVARRLELHAACGVERQDAAVRIAAS